MDIERQYNDSLDASFTALLIPTNGIPLQVRPEMLELLALDDYWTSFQSLCLNRGVRIGTL